MVSDSTEIEARGEVKEARKKTRSPWKKAPPSMAVVDDENRPVMGSESWPALADAKSIDSGSKKTMTLPPVNAEPPPPPPPVQVRILS